MKKKVTKGVISFLVLGLFVFSTAIFADEIAEKTKKGYMGVNLSSLSRTDRKELSVEFGVLVSAVQKDSPAYKADILEDDVIQYYDGKIVKDSLTLSEYVRETEVGTKVKIKLIRTGKSKVISLKIGERKDDFLYFKDGKSDKNFPAKKGVKFYGDLKHLKEFKNSKKWDTFKNHKFYTNKKRAYLGVQMQKMNTDLKKYFNKSGALVWTVEEDSPAEEAGLKSGDVIVKIGDKAVKEIDEVSNILSEFKPEEEVKIKIVRLGKTKTLKVKLGESSGFLGLQFFGNKNFPNSKTIRYHFPKKMEILKSNVKNLKKRIKDQVITIKRSRVSI